MINNKNLSSDKKFQFYLEHAIIMCNPHLSLPSNRYNAYIKGMCQELFPCDWEKKLLFTGLLGRGRSRKTRTVKSYKQRCDLLKQTTSYKEASLMGKKRLYKLFRAKELSRQKQHKEAAIRRIQGSYELGVTHGSILCTKYKNKVDSELINITCSRQYKRLHKFLFYNSEIESYEQFISEFGYPLNQRQRLKPRGDLSEHSTAINRFTWRWV